MRDTFTILKAKKQRKNIIEPWPGFWTQKKHYVISRWYSMTGLHEVTHTTIFVLVFYDILRIELERYIAIKLPDKFRQNIKK